ncbi:MAG TPA: DUF2007 domain-containing protein [Draconibacterium sp.]|nr:DUF2007 domain-containing protein [Draconibacterium sp.]
MEDNIVKIYTGGDVIINRLKVELEAQGIYSLVKDGYKEGLAAGFGEGVPSAIDLFVLESDLAKALEVVNAITKE